MGKETFYFSHDYNARSDEKIKSLLRKHGILGYGIFWAIVEDLYNNANALRTHYDGIAFDLRVDENMVKSIVNDFDLFIIDGDFFGSSAVETRINERISKSVKARQSANKRWSNLRIDANACVFDANAMLEKKRKEINKVNKSKIVSASPPKFSFKKAFLDLGVSEEVLNDWLIVRKNKKASNTETAFNAIKSEFDKNKTHTAHEIICICAAKDWKGFKNEWLISNNIQNGGNKQSIAKGWQPTGFNQDNPNRHPSESGKPNGGY